MAPLHLLSKVGGGVPPPLPATGCGEGGGSMVRGVTVNKEAYSANESEKD